MSYEFDLIEFDETDHIDVGDTAPDFARPLVTHEYWETVSLSSLASETSCLLVLHPMDGAYPALYFWQEVRDRGWAELYDVPVVGLTISTPYAHHEFLNARAVPHRLFSDPQNTIASEYGVVHELDGMDGVSEPRFSLFHVDEDLTVQYAWVADRWPQLPEYDEIEREVLT